MAVGKRSKTAEGNAARYKSENRAEANRKKRLERTLKAQPNNLQVKAALKTSKIHRKTPVKPIWSATWITTAKLFKEFGGRFDTSIMSANLKVAQEALQKQSKTAAYIEANPSKERVPKSFFSIATRLGQ